MRHRITRGTSNLSLSRAGESGEWPVPTSPRSNQGKRDRQRSTIPTAALDEEMRVARRTQFGPPVDPTDLWAGWQGGARTRVLDVFEEKRHPRNDTMGDRYPIWWLLPRRTGAPNDQDSIVQPTKIRYAPGP